MMIDVCIEIEFGGDMLNNLKLLDLVVCIGKLYEPECGKNSNHVISGTEIMLFVLVNVDLSLFASITFKNINTRL